MITTAISMTWYKTRLTIFVTFFNLASYSALVLLDRAFVLCTRGFCFDPSGSLNSYGLDPLSGELQLIKNPLKEKKMQLSLLNVLTTNHPKIKICLTRLSSKWAVPLRIYYLFYGVQYIVTADKRFLHHPQSYTGHIFSCQLLFQ